MSNKALDFLLTLTTDKSMVMTTPDFWSKPKTTRSFHTGGDSDKNFKQEPYNFETASVWRRFKSDEGYGSGIGDLWGFTYWCSLNEALARTYFEEEKKRVKEKYNK